MEPWHKQIHPLGTFKPKSKGMDIDDNVALSGEKSHLSYLTNLFLNTFIETMDKKNLIVLMPDLILKTTPIVSYVNSYTSKRSTLIFTSKGTNIKDNPQKIHNRNYSLLSWYGDNDDYLVYDIPIGLISLKEIKADPYITRACDNIIKRRIKKLLEQNLLESKKPKILLYHDDEGIKITKTMDKLILEDREINKQINIDIGCIIFENVDRFIRSKHMATYFIEWLKLLSDKNINFIFHFSNPESIFIDDIKKATNSLVLSFDSLMRNNLIKERSINYFKETKFMEFRGKYNIDNPYFYEDGYYNDNNIILYKPSLKAGNLDHYFRNIFYLEKKVDKAIIKNNRLYNKVLNTIYTLPNLTINPSKYQLRYNDPERIWYDIPSLLKKFNDELIHDDVNELFLKQLLSEFYSVYFELSECDRYYEKGSYNRIAKDYKILEIAENSEIFQDDKEIIFVTYGYERTILESEIEHLNSNNDIRVYNINWLNKSYFDRSKFNLVLPGPLPHPYLSELTFPYNEIILLTYEGYNYNRTIEQIDAISKYPFEKERKSMKYLGEIYDFIGIPKNKSIIFKDFKKRASMRKLDHQNDSNKEIINPFDEIRKNLLNYKYSLEYEKNIGSVEKKITEYENNDENVIKTDESIEMQLRNLNNSEGIITKRLLLGKTYFYLEDLNDEVLEGTPQNFKQGNFVIILDNDVQKTLLQLVIEIFGLEKSVNKPIIEYWKEQLMKFIKENKLSYKKLHRLYTEVGGTKTYAAILDWAKGRVIGPRDPMDLYYIGKILNDDIILQNYQIMEKEIEKIRNIHLINGRRLKKVVKGILSKGDLNLLKLTKEEYLFYDKVKNGIYEIININN